MTATPEDRIGHWEHRRITCMQCRDDKLHRRRYRAAEQWECGEYDDSEEWQATMHTPNLAVTAIREREQAVPAASNGAGRELPVLPGWERDPNPYGAGPRMIHPPTGSRVERRSTGWDWWPNFESVNFQRDSQKSTAAEAAAAALGYEINAYSATQWSWTLRGIDSIDRCPGFTSAESAAFDALRDAESRAQAAEPAAELLRFNINDHVRIRLTDRGHRICEQAEHFSEPTPDERGYVRMQAWDVMNVFGRHMYNGCDIPFETTIEIEVAAEPAAELPCKHCGQPRDAGHSPLNGVCLRLHSDEAYEPAAPEPAAEAGGLYALGRELLTAIAGKAWTRERRDLIDRFSAALEHAGTIRQQERERCEAELAEAQAQDARWRAELKDQCRIAGAAQHEADHLRRDLAEAQAAARKLCDAVDRARGDALSDLGRAMMPVQRWDDVIAARLAMDSATRGDSDGE